LNSKNEIIKENESSLIEPLNRKTTTSPIPIINNNRLELTTTNNLFKNSPVLYNSSELLVPTSASTNNLNDVNKSNNNKFYNNSRNDKYDLLFDNSTLDPFHDMELNAINDKEELRNILEKSSLLTNNNNLEQSNDNFGLPNVNFNNNNLNI
jgi:hypothetical protein